MKLYQFNEWKNETITYWTNAVTSSANGLVSTPASSDTTEFSNTSAMLNYISNSISAIEIKYFSYKNSPEVLDKTKDALLAIMSYISMKDVIKAIGEPIISNAVSSTKDWYSVYTLELPDIPSFFTISNEVITNKGGSASPYQTNQDLINAHLWYSGTVCASPPVSGFYSLTSTNGLITCPLSATINTMVNCITSDINSINNFQNTVVTKTKDNIIYRLYGEPQTIVTTKKPKSIVLEDYKFSEVLTMFNWTIKGIN